ncbi:MAG: hypothetical protein H6621_01065 [Halobacteriovoraceae bacterium]|nr:hypothetical protein [Halobacteriovoraceae bacterium]MCB9093632.1 hypothetical protein [Halobacteriovoraceae bacterium]
MKALLVLITFSLVLSSCDNNKKWRGNTFILKQDGVKKENPEDKSDEVEKEAPPPAPPIDTEETVLPKKTNTNVDPCSDEVKQLNSSLVGFKEDMNNRYSEMQSSFESVKLAISEKDAMAYNKFLENFLEAYARYNLYYTEYLPHACLRDSSAENEAKDCLLEDNNVWNNDRLNELCDFSTLESQVKKLHTELVATGNDIQNDNEDETTDDQQQEVAKIDSVEIKVEGQDTVAQVNPEISSTEVESNEGIETQESNDEEVIDHEEIENVEEDAVVESTGKNTTTICTPGIVNSFSAIQETNVVHQRLVRYHELSVKISDDILNARTENVDGAIANLKEKVGLFTDAEKAYTAHFNFLVKNIKDNACLYNDTVVDIDRIRSLDKTIGVNTLHLDVSMAYNKVIAQYGEGEKEETQASDEEKVASESEVNKETKEVETKEEETAYFPQCTEQRKELISNIATLYNEATNQSKKLRDLYALFSKLDPKVEMHHDILASEAEIDSLNKTLQKTTKDLRKDCADFNKNYNVCSYGDVVIDERYKKFCEDFKSLEVNIDQKIIRSKVAPEVHSEDLSKVKTTVKNSDDMTDEEILSSLGPNVLPVATIIAKKEDSKALKSIKQLRTNILNTVIGLYNTSDEAIINAGDVDLDIFSTYYTTFTNNYQKLKTTAIPSFEALCKDVIGSGTVANYEIDSVKSLCVSKFISTDRELGEVITSQDLTKISWVEFLDSLIPELEKAKAKYNKKQ